MHIFKDNTGRTWEIAIHVTAVKDCRAYLGLELYSLVDDGFKGLGELLSNAERLNDVLYVLCMDEAKSRGVSDRDFGRAMRGDAIVEAAEAFHDEYADFFHNPLTRAGLKKLAEARGRLTKRILEERLPAIEEMDLDSLVERSIVLYGDSPASSESTPDRALSASLP